MDRHPSGLVEHADFDQVVLELEQRPAAAWIPLVFPLFFVFTFASAVAPLLAQISVVLFVGIFVLAFAGTGYRPRLRLEIGPARVKVRGWLGALPLPKEVTIDLVSATATWSAGALVNGVQLWVLDLGQGPGTLVIPSLRCTPAELSVVADRLEGMRLLAEHKHGAGEAEVPPALRDLRRAVRE